MLTSEQAAETLLRERLGLTAYVYSVARNYHLAEDVFQEVSVKAIGRADKFESERHLINWFRLSGRNRAIDIIRSRDGRYVGLSESAMSALETDWITDSEANREEAIEALTSCLETLTPRNQQIVKLRYFENRSGKEIAAFMDRKIESMYQAIARIHKTLSKCVSKRLANPTL